MLNVPELERRWKRYRRSKQIPYIMAGGVTAIVLAGILYTVLTPETEHADNSAAVTTADSNRSSHALAQATTPMPEMQQAKPLQTPPHQQAPSVPPDHQTLKLTPSMNFMQDFESDVMNYYFSETPSEPAPAVKAEPRAAEVPVSVPQVQAKPPVQSSLPSIAPRNTPTETVAIPKEVVVHEDAPEPAATQQPASGQMMIQRENDMKDIQDVIARFKKNKNPVLSLFVAKRYYQIGNFQQAYNYALITNELDSGIEDSWLIFAKSLYKLDQKDMAIKTLKTYVQDSSSVKAKITLDQMEKGTFE
jgi:hypothetical protein